MQCASNYTWSPSKWLLLDTSYVLSGSVCARFSTVRPLCLTRPRHCSNKSIWICTEIWKRIILCWCLLACGTKKHMASVSASLLPKVQLLCQPLIINRCTLSGDKHLTSKGWDISQQEIRIKPLQVWQRLIVFSWFMCGHLRHCYHCFHAVYH